MDKVEAVWYAAGSSRQQPATLWIENGSVYVQSAGGDVHTVPLAKVRLSARLAEVPRQLQLPDGTMVSVANNAFIDNALSAHSRHGFGKWVHVMESRLHWLLLLLLAAVATLAGAYEYGLPVAGSHVAQQIPDDYISEISETVYNNLHKEGLLAASQLSQQQQQRAQRLFARVAENYPQLRAGLRLRLHRWGLFEAELANAFALPDGLIIVTDGLMHLLTDDEITAVMAHEVGHVYHRHSMRALVQAAGVSALVFFFFGDFSGLSAVPIVLANLKYSRDFEREADCFAYDYLSRHDMSPALIGSALNKMEATMEAATELTPADANGNEESTAAKPQNSDETVASPLWQNLWLALSTHPPTAERADLAQHCD